MNRSPAVTTKYLSKDQYPFWLLACALAAIIFTLYSVSLGHGFYFDEQGIILNNPYIRSLSQIPQIFKYGYFFNSSILGTQWNEYYRPVTMLTFALDHFFWKFNPLGYNLTNLGLHLTLSILYFKFLSKLLSHRLAAFFAALLYGAHTIHTEAVTYIASRGDVLGIVLMLAAMLYYLRGKTFIAAGCYFLALFSKESMILLPFYILVIDLGFVKSSPKELIKKIAPFFAVMIFFWLFRRFLCPIPFVPSDPDLRSTVLRVLGMGDGILRYLGALAAPEYFRMFADVPKLYGFSDPLLWTTVTVGALLLAAWILTLRYRGLAFIGMSVFLIGLVPHLQLVRVNPEWAEHYICVSSLGLFLLLGMVFRAVLNAQRKIAALFFLGLYLPFLVFVSVRTWQRNEIYNDPEKLYTLLSQSDSFYCTFGLNSIAQKALNQHDPDLAMVYLRASLQSQFNSEAAHYLMGWCYRKKNNREDSAREFRLAYFYSTTSPKELQAVGNKLMEAGRYEDATYVYWQLHVRCHGSEAPYAQMMALYEVMKKDAKVREWAAAGLKDLAANQDAAAYVKMALAKYEYRRGRTDLARKIMEDVQEKYPVSRDAELARLCLGKTTPQKFSKILSGKKFKYLKEIEPRLLLMSYVMQGQREQVLIQLKKEREFFRKQAKKNVLTQIELRRVYRFLDY